MKKYQDKWTRFHDKPTDGVNPSSNNGWIYSAYSTHLLPNKLDHSELRECYNGCKTSNNPLKIDRSPDQLEPPISKDEIIGLVSLGLLSKEELEDNYWNFCNLPEYKQRPMTIGVFFKSIKALYNVYKESKDLEGGAKRNYLWKNKVVEAYPLAFRLPVEDIYYVKKVCGDSPSIFETLWFFVAACFTIFNGNRSVRMLLWLQMSDMYPRLAKLLPKKKWVKDYFREGHPFRDNL